MVCIEGMNKGLSIKSDKYFLKNRMERLFGKTMQWSAIASPYSLSKFDAISFKKIFILVSYYLLQYPLPYKVGPARYLSLQAFVQITLSFLQTSNHPSPYLL